MLFFSSGAHFSEICQIHCIKALQVWKDYPTSFFCCFSIVVVAVVLFTFSVLFCLYFLEIRKRLSRIPISGRGL